MNQGVAVVVPTVGVKINHFYVGRSQFGFCEILRALQIEAFPLSLAFSGSLQKTKVLELSQPEMKRLHTFWQLEKDRIVIVISLRIWEGTLKFTLHRVRVTASVYNVIWIVPS